MTGPFPLTSQNIRVKICPKPHSPKVTCPPSKHIFHVRENLVTDCMDLNFFGSLIIFV